MLQASQFSLCVQLGLIQTNKQTNDPTVRFPAQPRKGEDLMKRLREKGMWEWDEDFPKDEEESLSRCNRFSHVSFFAVI